MSIAAPEKLAAWSNEPVEALVEHLLETHHVFTRDALEALEPLVERVARVHGPNHPELARVREIFFELKADLEPHLFKEERILFPFISSLGRAQASGQAAPRPMFGTVANPVQMMNHEHDGMNALLDELRTLTRAYSVPDDACGSYRAMLTQLAAFDADLVQHVHLESDLLFPRAVELERRLLG